MAELNVTGLHYALVYLQKLEGYLGLELTVIKMKREMEPRRAVRSSVTSDDGDFKVMIPRISPSIEKEDNALTCLDAMVP